MIGSPQLDQPQRTRQKAALDIAVAGLRRIAYAERGPYETEMQLAMRSAALMVLHRIAILVPEITTSRDGRGRR